MNSSLSKANACLTNNLDFEDWSAFLQWKETEEKATFTYYTKPKGSHRSGDGEGIINSGVQMSSIIHTLNQQGHQY